VVLQCLEPQYQRKSTTYIEAAEFIKREKKSRYLLDVSDDIVKVDTPPWGDRRSLEVVTDGVMLLENFVSVSNRDVPPSVKLQTKLLGLKFKYLYFDSKREEVLRNLNQALKTSFSCDFEVRFISAF
jgi:hypothetical protein